MNNARRGRRSGSPDTRAQILAVAHRCFLSQGYQKVTLRAVAAEAGVDAALVSYYFGSKKGLLAAALALTVNPPELLRTALAGDLATLPERVIRTVVATWDDASRSEQLRLMVAAAAQEPELARLLREVLRTEMVHRVAERFHGPDAAARAGAFGAQVAGLIFTRYWLALEPVASMPVGDLVRFFAPGLHAAMRGPGPHARPPGGEARPPGGEARPAAASRPPTPAHARTEPT